MRRVPPPRRVQRAYATGGKPQHRRAASAPRRAQLAVCVLRKPRMRVRAQASMLVWLFWSSAGPVQPVAHASRRNTPRPSAMRARGARPRRTWLRRATSQGAAQNAVGRCSSPIGHAGPSDVPTLQQETRCGLNAVVHWYYLIFRPLMPSLGRKCWAWLGFVVRFKQACAHSGSLKWRPAPL